MADLAKKLAIGEKNIANPKLYEDMSPAGAAKITKFQTAIADVKAQLEEAEVAWMIAHEAFEEANG
jgi:hypothetical protein